MTAPVRIAGLAAILVLLGSDAGITQETPPPFAVFEVPLGGTMADIDRMAAKRGYRPLSRPGYCPGQELCRNVSNLENLPKTDFINQIWGWRETADRKESFRFVFTAGPNEHRIWSAGSDQEFGKWFGPSAAAPLARDVLAALFDRYGRPAITYGPGGAILEGRSEQPVEYWWLWDAKGNPASWGPLKRGNTHLRSPCYGALLQAATTPGSGITGTGNASVTSPNTFRAAREGNCAVALRAEVYQAKGLVHKLSIRMVDFQRGHDANYATTRHISALRVGANAERSERNRPDF